MVSALTVAAMAEVDFGRSAAEYGVLTPDIKRKVLGLNMAKLYDIEVPVQIPSAREAVAR